MGEIQACKAWLVGRRNEARWKWHYDYAFRKRPAEQLFDLRRDPDQTVDVAADPNDYRSPLLAVKGVTDCGDAPAHKWLFRVHGFLSLPEIRSGLKLLHIPD